jgi:hypothetical protein
VLNNLTTKKDNNNMAIHRNKKGQFTRKQKADAFDLVAIGALLILAGLHYYYGSFNAIVGFIWSK